MKIFSKENVYKSAIERVRFLFQEFPNVIVSFSGGKDSTVVLNLCLEVARELDRLPLTVMWIDQEAEWQGTVDYCQYVFNMEEVNPMWFQFPMKWHNNISHNEKYIEIWKEGAKWIRDKVECSYKENNYEEVGFQNLFPKIAAEQYPNEKACYVTGVRTEETPKRYMALTNALTYKQVTWGKILDKKLEHYTFAPIYDWEYSDVWKYIFDNNIKYNRIYNELYKHGVQPMQMRISNLHHETSVQSLLLVQEIEPDTWNKVCARYEGINTIKHLQLSAIRAPKTLPPMFRSWKEYCLYLAEVMIKEQQYKDAFHKKIEPLEKYILNQDIEDDLYKCYVSTIILSDWDFTKIANFITRPEFYALRKYVNGKITAENLEANRKSKYLKGLI